MATQTHERCFIFSLTKDQESRPTFADLANTAFYQYYNSMDNLSELVGQYVAEILSKIEALWYVAD